ncbi:MAG: glycerol-3-phosphate acyltransferase, partial [Rhodospirillaceae bacterium]|nr:glycerol-3-phosphate acyltransferase [Rhodospirillaceae bacterium]
LISAPGFAYLLSGRQLAELAGLLAIIIAFKHHANIRRLLGGRESKIGSKK